MDKSLWFNDVDCSIQSDEFPIWQTTPSMNPACVFLEFHLQTNDGEASPFGMAILTSLRSDEGFLGISWQVKKEKQIRQCGGKAI
jgi:hypothetical protein